MEPNLPFDAIEGINGINHQDSICFFLRTYPRHDMNCGLTACTLSGTKSKISSTAHDVRVDGEDIRLPDEPPEHFTNPNRPHARILIY